jgi:hypothetical protein
VARLASSDIFSLRFPDHPFSQGIQEVVALIESVT